MVICGRLNVQSFGAKNYSVLGIVLQRALLVTAAASVVIIAFWTQMGKLLILLGRLLLQGLGKIAGLCLVMQQGGVISS